MKKEKVDKDFELLYENLSYRRKFIRTLWLIPIGIVVGIFAVSKLIEWLFAKFPSVTYSAILGLIVASPIGILAKMKHNNINAVSILVGIVLFVASAWFTYWFSKKTEGIEK